MRRRGIRLQLFSKLPKSTCKNFFMRTVLCSRQRSFFSFHYEDDDRRHSVNSLINSFRACGAGETVWSALTRQRFGPPRLVILMSCVIDPSRDSSLHRSEMFIAPIPKDYRSSFRSEMLIDKLKCVFVFKWNLVFATRFSHSAPKGACLVRERRRGL